MPIINVETITNSSLGVSLLAATLAHMDPRFGHRLADFIGDRLAANRNSKLVRAVRANQAVLLGEAATTAALDRAVRDALRSSARSVFDLYRYIDEPEAFDRLVVLEDGMPELISRAEFAEDGLVAVGPHLSSFDLLARWICGQIVRPLVLTLPNPRGGRRVEYEMRQQMGVNLVPSTIAGLRKAVRHLQHGGAVLTSLDRPIPKPRVQPRFFGRPAAVPVHHIFLAMKARVPLVVVATMLEEDGRYHVHRSDWIEMETNLEGDKQVLHNAEKVLHVAEGFIRRAPQQWSVPLPVWPTAASLVPH
jgi:lauroyl/myristoyl acyltransferase